MHNLKPSSSASIILLAPLQMSDSHLRGGCRDLVKQVWSDAALAVMTQRRELRPTLRSAYVHKAAQLRSVLGTGDARCQRGHNFWSVLDASPSLLLSRRRMGFKVAGCQALADWHKHDTSGHWPEMFIPSHECNVSEQPSACHSLLVC